MMNRKKKSHSPKRTPQHADLEQEPDFLSSVTQQISDALIITDKAFKIVFINKAAATLFGYKKKELLGKSPDILNAEPFAGKIQRDIYKTVAGRRIWKGIVLNRKKSGKTFWAEMKISPLKGKWGHVNFFIGVIRDVTRRRQEEEKWHASREMLQLVLDNIPQRIFWKDRKSVYLGCNKTFAEDAGLRHPGQIVGRNDFDLPWDKKETEFYRQIDQHVMKSNQEELSIIESQRRLPEAPGAWVRTNKVPMHNARGHVIGILGTYEDITEKKKAEEALRESEEKYRTLFESAADAIFIADVETGYIVDANRKSETLLGRPLKNIIGSHFTGLHPNGELKYYRDLFWTHTQQDSEIKSVAFVQHADGRKIPVHISGGLCELNGRKVIIGIFRDITALKLVEENLRQDKVGLEEMVGKTTEMLKETRKELEDAKRLSEIGALAAMVAHELRNPLGVIKTAVYNIKQKTKDASLNRHTVNIEKKITESEKIIRELLNFSQIKIPRYTPVPMIRILKETIAYCRGKYADRQITVRLKIRPKGVRTAVIEADPVHINELFMNILENAYQAFGPGKGSIDINLDYNTRKGICSISFEDNGLGIAPQDIPRIYDPFFTTKTKGTGLGLSVCNQLVNLYGGQINITSQKGQGTAVSLILPIKRKHRA